MGPLAVIALVLALVGGGAAHDKVATTPVTWNPTVVVVRNEIGSLTVANGPGRVVVHKQWNFRGPTAKVERHGDALVITGKCPNNVVQNNCSVDVQVVLPNTFALDVEQDLGDISVRDVSGPERLHAGLGDIEMHNVRGDQLSADAFGDIALDAAAPPQIVNANSSNGSVDIGVPAGAYAITTHTSWNDAEVRGLTDDPNAQRKINAASSNGDVLIHSR
ncbi:MAG: hypothetical protein QOK28_1306 [Actinomycetota bacterium]|jgi:hypothetical protein